MIFNFSYDKSNILKLRTQKINLSKKLPTLKVMNAIDLRIIDFIVKFILGFIYFVN